jgi:peroxiredoxin
MNKILIAAAAAMLLPTFAMANVEPGASAPDFTVKDVSGKDVKLSQFRGKHVVLEWVNPGCPFVQKHYNSKNMQALQGEFTGKDVIWLTVNSTSSGHQDFRDAAAMGKWMNEQQGKPSSILMDTSGAVGKQYGAKTTPHMWVINPQGKVVYAGGIDDKRSARVEDVPGAKNFVKAALSESMAGKEVTVASAPPYGCSVKY